MQTFGNYLKESVVKASKSEVNNQLTEKQEIDYTKRPGYIGHFKCGLYNGDEVVVFYDDDENTIELSLGEAGSQYEGYSVGLKKGEVDKLIKLLTKSKSSIK